MNFEIGKTYEIDHKLFGKFSVLVEATNSAGHLSCTIKEGGFNTAGVTYYDVGSRVTLSGRLITSAIEWLDTQTQER